MRSSKAKIQPTAVSLGRGWLRRAFLVVGLLVVAVGVIPAWRRVSCAYYVSTARSELSEFEFLAALKALDKAERLDAQRVDVQYLLAVANRRSGRLDKVEPRLKAAEQGGWPRVDLDRQRLLLVAQVGRFNEVEAQLQALFAAQADDEAAIEVYEALAHGYWSNHRIHDALKALNFWINWRPRDSEPRVMRADVYTQFNDPVSAEKEYRDILAFAPQHRLAHEMLGRLLLQASKVDEAAEHFRSCVTHGEMSASVLAGLAECEFRSSRSEEADRWLSQIKTEDMPAERRVKVLKLKADIARFRQKNDEALAILTKAVADWPHDGGVHQSLGQTYAALGNRELATKHLDLSKEILARGGRFSDLQRRVVKAPEDANLRFEAAELLISQGLPTDAIGWLRSAVRYDPRHQPSLEALADYYEELGDRERTDKYRQAASASVEVSFRRAWEALSANELISVKRLAPYIAKYPDFAGHASLLEAALLVKEGEHDAAEQKLKSPLRWPALRPFALTVAAESLVAQGRGLEGEPLLLEALNLNESFLEAHRWLAVIYYDLGAINQAAAHLNHVAELDPRDYRAHRLLGLMNNEFEIYEVAIQMYRDALSRNPPQGPREEILVELAECLIRLKSFDEALKILEAAAPSTERSVFMADCLISTNRRDEAVQLLDQVLAEAPKNAAALVFRGDAALVDGEIERAEELYQRAVAEDPFNVTTHFKMSQALTRTGKESESREHLQRSEELKKLRGKFTKLLEEAIAKPFDAPVRRELASTAELLGLADLAKVWTKAAVMLEKRDGSSAEVKEIDGPAGAR